MSNTDFDGVLFRHKKRGTLYSTVARGKLQVDGPADMADVITYRDVNDGSVWTRPVSEFYDGRFEIVPDDKATEKQKADFQSRVNSWMQACFGREISNDKQERNHRFLEEAIELVQACGCTRSEAHQLVDYVYGRPVGEIEQETGGVMVTLAALCLAQGISMEGAGETELARIWTKVEKIRAKQAAKPKHSPLPDEQPSARNDTDRLEWLERLPFADVSQYDAGWLIAINRVAITENMPSLRAAIDAAMDKESGEVGHD